MNSNHDVLLAALGGFAFIGPTTISLTAQEVLPAPPPVFKGHIGLSAND